MPGCQTMGQYDDKAGKDYKGTMAKTISGRECQNWSKQKPQAHKYEHVGKHNYCRNPDDHVGVESIAISVFVIIG